MVYRRDIDGLRAFAVLAVILFHSGIGLLPGGFLGVDVFFVISGYLITALILAEIASGEFSFAQFYLRRARRLLPALFLVLIASLVLGWRYLLPDAYAAFARTVVPSTLFFANIHFWRSTGYFDTAAEEKPLIHLWTLGVEEQFYLVFPIVLILMVRLRPKRFWAAATLFILGSFALAVTLSVLRPSASFYLLPTRFWEFGLGAVMARWHPSSPDPRSGRAQALSAVGLALICGSFVLGDPRDLHPGPVTLVPVLGTCLVLGWAGATSFVSAILAARPVVFVGMISYSAYLWHQPVFAFARARQIAPLGDFQALSLSVLAVGLAAVTWFCVEQPFRGRSRWMRLSDRGFGIVMAGLAMPVLAGAVFIQTNAGLPSRLPEQTRQILLDPQNQRPDDPCHHSYDTPVVPDLAAPCRRPGKDGQIPVMLIGDSHAAVLGAELDRDLAEKGIGLIRWTGSGCPGLPDFSVTTNLQRHYCQIFTDEGLALARANGVKTLILSARWPLYLSDEVFDNVEGGREPESNLETTYRSDPGRAAKSRGLARELTALAQEFTIVFVLPIPEAGWNVPKAAAVLSMAGHLDGADLTTSRDRHLERAARTLSIVKPLEEQGQLVLVPVADLFCSKATGRCANLDAAGTLYRDDDHLTLRGAERVVTAIVPVIESLLLPVPSGSAP